MTECARCGDSFTPTNKTGPKPRYCSSTCRDRHRTIRATQEIRDARNARNCSDCGEDITQTTHPLATRCGSCQAAHRKNKPRTPKPKVERFCDGCGKSITGTRKGKTVCAFCGRPPRLCIVCGLVDLKGSRSWRCDECKAEWDAGESERVRQWQADNPEATMVTRARSRAKAKGIDCTITVKDVKAAWPDDNLCLVCGTGMIRNLGTASGSSDSPSLDRIDNEFGYVPGNVHVVCAGCNGKKRDMALAELADGHATPEWQDWALGNIALAV